MEFIKKSIFELEVQKRFNTGQHLSDDEFGILRDAIKFHDGISPDAAYITKDFIDDLRKAFLDTYGGMDAIGDRRIEYFFLNFKFERILVLRDDVHDKVNNILCFDDENLPLDPNANYRIGANHPFSGVITLREIDANLPPLTHEQSKKFTYQLIFLEELCHQFIRCADPEAFSQVRQHVNRMKGEIIEELQYRFNKIEWSRNTAYWANPDEEIVKAMQVKLLTNLWGTTQERVLSLFGNLSLAGENFVQTAIRGQKRIEKQGWQKILRGDLGPRYI